MTLFGLAALIAGAASLTLGLVFDWLALDLVGLGLLAVVVLGFISVARPSRLVIDREIQPPRVPKGSPAIAFLTFANRGRRSVPVTVATQHVQQPAGAHRDPAAARRRARHPRLSAADHPSRHLRRGAGRDHPSRPVRVVPAVPQAGRDRTHLGLPADACRCTPCRPGQRRDLEGPSSDTSPAGQHHVPPAARLRGRRRPAADPLALVGPGRAGCSSSTTSTPLSRTPSCSSTSGRASTPRSRSSRPSTSLRRSLVAPPSTRRRSSCGSPTARSSAARACGRHAADRPPHRRAVRSPAGTLQPAAARPCAAPAAARRWSWSPVSSTRPTCPTSPALRRRFDRLVVISFRHRAPRTSTSPASRSSSPPTPTPSCAAWNLQVHVGERGLIVTP